MAIKEPAEANDHLSLAACISLCLLGPLSGLAISGLSPILPQISAHFSADPNAGMLVRLMTSGLSASMILGALASGFLANRIGQLRLLLIALVIYGLAGAAGAVLDNLYLMVASRIVLGIVNAAAGVLAMALITTRVALDQRDRWLGFYIVGATVGVLLLMIVIGVLGRLDWRYVFLLHLLAIPVALLIASTFSATSRAEQQAASAAASGGGVPWGMIMFGLICGAIGTSTFMYLPFHLASIGLGNPGKLAPALTISTAAGGALSLAYGWIRKHFGAIQLFIGGFALTALGLQLILLTASYPAILAGMAIYGAGFGVVTPNLFAACAAATRPELRPRMLGFIRAGFYAGPLLAQFFLELVLHRWGPAAPLEAIVLAALAAAVLALLQSRLFAPVEIAAASPQ